MQGIFLLVKNKFKFKRKSIPAKDEKGYMRKYPTYFAFELQSVTQVKEEWLKWKNSKVVRREEGAEGPNKQSPDSPFSILKWTNWTVFRNK